MKLKRFLAMALLAMGLLSSNLANTTTSNYTTFTDGSVLTAGDLNSLQTHYTNADNAILDGDTFTGNMAWHSGSDILMYSDTGSTLKVGIYGNNSNLIAAPFRIGDTSNCSIANASTTFSITGEGGTALSATNPCIVRIRSNTAGQSAIATFTSDIDVTHGASSNTDGNAFGLTITVDWASDMPLFLGVIYDGTTPYFTISRGPITESGSDSTDLCQLDDTDCDAQTDVMILTTGLTLSSWTELPITPVGWLQATFSTTGDAWTFVVNDKTGFNDAVNQERWDMVVSQNGAATGKYFNGNGSTSPTYTALNNYKWTTTMAGVTCIEGRFDNDSGGTAGSGSGLLSLILPVAPVGVSRYLLIGNMTSFESGGTSEVGMLQSRPDLSDYSTQLKFEDNGTIKCNDQSSTDRDINVSGCYQSF